MLLLPWDSLNLFIFSFANSNRLKLFHSSCSASACGFLLLSFCSDIFEEQGFDSLAWDGKFGMQTIAQVPKPVYRAMQLIANQPANTVPLTVIPPAGVTPLYRATSVTAGTVDATVAVESDGSRVVALVTNFNTVGNPIAAQSVTVRFLHALVSYPAANGMPCEVLLYRPLRLCHGDVDALRLPSTLSPSPALLAAPLPLPPRCSCPSQACPPLHLPRPL